MGATITVAAVPDETAVVASIEAFYPDVHIAVGHDGITLASALKGPGELRLIWNAARANHRLLEQARVTRDELLIELTR